METFLVKYSVNGNTVETTIRAYNVLSANDIIKSQYPGYQVIIWSTTKVG